MAKKPEEEKQHHEPLDLSALLQALEAGEEDASSIQERLAASLTLGTVYEPTLLAGIIAFSAQSLKVTSGASYCKMVEILDTDWVTFAADDFTAISRNWETFKQRITDFNAHLEEIFSTTRREALEPSTSISKSENRMLVNGLTPVRLCSFDETANFADKAHLCPKNGEKKKAYTWMYVAAAVLGMPSETQEDRIALCKAVCGSVKEGNSSVTQAAGLNRSPFNLLYFLEQEEWFDKKPGVVVLPVLDEHQARDWNGAPYEIIIMCNDVPGKASAEAIATRIGLTSTNSELIQNGHADDIRKSVSLLRQVVKASAFCLEHKEGPDGGRGALLWKKFRDELEMTRQSTAALMNPRPQDNLRGRILVPIPRAERPEGKIVAKIDLARMTPPGEHVIAVYPDPLLLAYKSSINWTRYFRFQLMAEAEPLNIPGENTYPDDIFVPSDQVSKISVYSSLY